MIELYLSNTVSFTSFTSEFYNVPDNFKKISKDLKVVYSINIFFMLLNN